MKRRFILYRRKRGGMFYIEDTETHKQESTGTRNRAEATSLLNARNESVRQPHLNLQIAKAYLAGTDSGVATRTWQQALDAIVETKSGSTQDRWRRAAKETALDSIRNRVILETQAEHLFACLKAGTVSTNDCGHRIRHGTAPTFASQCQRELKLPRRTLKSSRRS